MRRILTLIFITSILVLPPSPAWSQKQVSDDEIHDQVRRRLANDPDVKGGAFEVDVKQGVVTIKGTVEKEKFRSKAEKLVKKVAGVKSVVNHVEVKAKEARK